ncbi:hypothetical protein QEN19_003056 [Hanseniaspora menglaensis]
MCGTIFLLILAVLFPPIPVIYLEGLYSKDFILNVLLLMLGYVPGVIHAIYLIFHSDRGSRHGYNEIEAQNGSRSGQHEPHDSIYQQGWDDRGRQENARSVSNNQSGDTKNPPPPYSM